MKIIIKLQSKEKETFNRLIEETKKASEGKTRYIETIYPKLIKIFKKDFKVTEENFTLIIKDF